MKLRSFYLKKIKKAVHNLQEHPLSSTDNANYKYWTEKLRVYDLDVLACKKEELRKCQKYCHNYNDMESMGWLSHREDAHDDMESMGWLNRGD